MRLTLLIIIILINIIPPQHKKRCASHDKRDPFQSVSQAVSLSRLGVFVAATRRQDVVHRRRREAPCTTLRH